jgi:tRNA-2-methylthio-N6-dimethylallyladenosine synthase
MAREYTREFYLDRVRKVRELLPDATISTDFIVGFPGETDDDFEDTLSLYREVEYDMAYMFIYSEREGTPAAIHFEDMPRQMKVERLSRLVELSKQISLEQNRKWIGREVEVLVQGTAEEEGYVRGHTRGNHVTLIKGELAPGIHQVFVAHATPNRLYCTTHPVDMSSGLASLPMTPSSLHDLSFAV